MLKKRRALKILTLNKLLLKLPILLAQIKAGYNSKKLINKIRQIVYLFDQHNTHKNTSTTINQVIIIIEVHIHDNKLLIMEPKTFPFPFGLSKEGDKNLQYEVDYIINHNGFLAE